MDLNEQIWILGGFHNFCAKNKIGFKWIAKEDIEEFINGLDKTKEQKDDIREFLLDILKDKICIRIK